MKAILFFLLSFGILNAKNGYVYTVFVCSDTTFEYALKSKEREIKEPKGDIYIIRSEAGAYRIAYGKFDTYREAEEFRKSLPANLQKWLPYTQKLTEEYIAQTESGKVTHYPYGVLDKEELDLKKDVPVEPETAKIERKSVSDSLKPKKLSAYEPSQFDTLLLYVDSEINRVFINGYQQNTKIRLGDFRISSAKKEIKKPTGRGMVTAISLNPVWYPTDETIKEFKEKKKIDLPKIVPPGDKYNYMGSAKIALSHTVDGRQTYRIHGTLNDKTIGRKESAGCIRMRNSEVEELAIFLRKFASLKGMNNIIVVMQ